MQPIEFDEFIRRVRRRAKLAGGIDIIVDSRSGKGSHRAVIFADTKTGRSAHFIAGGGREISPGLQRRAIAYMDSISSKNPVAEIAARILRDVCGR